MPGVLYARVGGAWVAVTASGGGSAMSDADTWKQPCYCATTANITLSGNQTIDGVALAGAMVVRVLVKNQTTTSQNGIYIFNTAGAWTRATDFDSSEEVRAASVAVILGTTQANTIWTVLIPTVLSAFTLGTNSIQWSQTTTSQVPPEERWDDLSVTTDASGNALVTFSRPFPTGHVPRVQATQGFANVHVTVFGVTESYVQLHYQRHDGSNVASVAVGTTYRAWWPAKSPT